MHNETEFETEFSQLFLQHHQQMRMLVLAIAPACNEVDDVVQEACAAMWRKKDQFDSSRKFAPWAMQFVRLQTLAWLKRKRVDRVRLSPGVVETICQSIGSDNQLQRDRIEALELCLGGLSVEDQNLLTDRYVHNVSIAELATKRINKKPDALYKLFARLKTSLLRCIASKIQEGSAS